MFPFMSAGAQNLYQGLGGWGLPPGMSSGGAGIGMGAGVPQAAQANPMQQFYQQALDQMQTNADMQRREQGGNMISNALSDLGTAISPADTGFFAPGSPWGGQMQQVQNPGINALLQILSGSGGWG